MSICIRGLIARYKPPQSGVRRAATPLEACAKLQKVNVFVGLRFANPTYGYTLRHLQLAGGTPPRPSARGAFYSS